MLDKKKMLVATMIIISIAIGIALGVYVLPKWKAKKLSSVENSYSVVYLSTGEVYIGKLSTFPKLRLDDAYLLQTVKDKDDPAKSSFQLTPLSEALWSPKTLYLNEKNMIFYGPINEDSKAAEAIKNAKR